MRKDNLCRLVGFILVVFVFTNSQAKPLWTFTPLTATTVNVPNNKTVVIQFRVTNQAERTKRLQMLPLQGVNANGPCILSPKGQVGSTCTLSLTINGNALPENGIQGGPSLCQTNSDGSPNPNQCYQPSFPDTLKISKTPSSTTLTTSINDLSLSVTGLQNGPAGPAIPSGKARVITITNTGDVAATDLNVSLPTLPQGSTATTTCGNSLPANVGNTCTITITPGNTATSDGANPCTNGSEPQPAVAQVTASNANSVSTNVLVLGYGCVFQGGYLFSVDDGTADTASIGGKVAAISDQSADARWSAVGVAVGGINENSVAGANSCDGNSDGACNTDRIIAAGLVQPIAAQLCVDLDDGGFNDWYLPAICEVGYDPTNAGTGCGTQAAPLLQNFYSILEENGIGNFAEKHYWSSTEKSPPDEANGAWETSFFPPDGDGVQGFDTKTNGFLAVRCARVIN